MTHYDIILIEDRKQDVAEILDCLKESAKEKSDKYDFHFEHIQGTEECNYEGEEYLFYNESILQTIEQKCAEARDQSKEKIGLLLDVMLTKEDLESNLSSYYPQAELAKQIYFKFYEQMPIYMITSSPVFATQSDVIMGTDLSEQYIAKNALLRYKFKDDIERLFAFYCNFKLTKNGPEVDYA